MRTFLVEDMALVRLKGVLTPAASGSTTLLLGAGRDADRGLNRDRPPRRIRSGVGPHRRRW
ncbi:MAG: hypothetical protein CK429_35225 [Mycobacterium sp.]|nr:MAG: hypothetical protein CK429_35225 [Mycobacterium sp.]